MVLRLSLYLDKDPICTLLLLGHASVANTSFHVPDIIILMKLQIHRNNENPFKFV